METAIITLKTQDGQFEQDMELPVNLSIDLLTDKLMEVLLTIDWQRFSSIKDPVLVSGGRVLDRHQTLEMLGIWDGSIIIIR